MQFDHVAIVVKNIKESVDWYVEKTSAVVEYCDDSWAMIKLGNSKIAFVLEGKHPSHLAFRVDSLDDLPKNVKIRTHRDGSKYVYQSDTQGNVVEFIYWPD